MKSLMAALTFLILFLSFNISAQVVSKDSISTLKQQKDALNLGQQINENKMKLAKLENSLEKQSKTSLQAQEDAQKSADDNASIASQLSTDASDRKLAKRSRKAAKSAERSATKARKAAGNLDDLQKEIESLRKQISADEEKLSTMPPIPMPGTTKQ